VHLLHERIDRLEPPLSAQPRDELDPNRPSVQLDVAVQDVRLDEHSATGSERRTYTDVDGGALPVDPGHVNTMAGTYQRLVGDHIGCRKPKLPAPALARDDFTAELKGRSQEASRRLDLSGEDQAPDVARGDNFISDLDQRDNAWVKVPAGGQ